MVETHKSIQNRDEYPNIPEKYAKRIMNKYPNCMIFNVYYRGIIQKAGERQAGLHEYEQFVDKKCTK